MLYFTATMHYLKRAFSKPIEIALMTLLPVGIIVINVVMNLHIITDVGGEYMYGGYNIMATIITILIVLMFQMMSGAYSGEYIFMDMRCDTRWRLRAAPVSPSVIVFGAIAASVIFSLLTACFVFLVTYFAFNVYLGNLVIIAPVVILTALTSQFIGIIIAMFVKTVGSINGIMIVLSFAMSALIGGFMINIPAPEFIRHHIIPTGVAFRAIATSSLTPIHGGNYTVNDSLVSLVILVGMSAFFGIATLMIARRRPA